jgi:hypothetical protein
VFESFEIDDKTKSFFVNSLENKYGKRLDFHWRIPFNFGGWFTPRNNGLDASLLVDVPYRYWRIARVQAKPFVKPHL